MSKIEVKFWTGTVEDLNSSGSFSVADPGEGPIEKKTYKQTILMRIATTLTMIPAGRTKGKGYEKENYL